MHPAMEKQHLSPRTEINTRMTAVSGTLITLKENEQIDDVLVRNNDAIVLVAGMIIGNDDANKSLIDAIKRSGIVCVIAARFRRDFFRQAINSGLALLAIDFIDKVKNGDTITIDLAKGKITLRDEEISFPSYPEPVLNIISSGSLMQAVKKALGKGE